MQIRDKSLRRHFFIYRVIIRPVFFLNVFPEMNWSWLQRRQPGRHEFAFLNLASARWVRIAQRIFHERHMRLQAWHSLSIPGSWNCTNSDDRSRRGAARRGVRLDKRNFEGHRIPLSDDRRSLREPDRFDALPPRRTRSPSCKPVHCPR